MAHRSPYNTRLRQNTIINHQPARLSSPTPSSVIGKRHIEATNPIGRHALVKNPADTPIQPLTKRKKHLHPTRVRIPNPRRVIIVQNRRRNSKHAINSPKVASSAQNAEASVSRTISNFASTQSFMPGTPCMNSLPIPSPYAPDLVEVQTNPVQAPLPSSSDLGSYLLHDEDIYAGVAVVDYAGAHEESPTPTRGETPIDIVDDIGVNNLSHNQSEVVGVVVGMPGGSTNGSWSNNNDTSSTTRHEHMGDSDVVNDGADDIHLTSNGGDMVGSFDTEDGWVGEDGDRPLDGSAGDIYTTSSPSNTGNFETEDDWMDDDDAALDENSGDMYPTHNVTSGGSNSGEERMEGGDIVNASTSNLRSASSHDNPSRSAESHICDTGLASSNFRDSLLGYPFRPQGRDLYVFGLNGSTMS